MSFLLANTSAKNVSTHTHKDGVRLTMTKSRLTGAFTLIKRNYKSEHKPVML
jgi:hypothetical protein